MEEATWLRPPATPKEEIPQELKDWARSSASTLDAPLEREWYKLEVFNTTFTAKTLQSGPLNNSRTTQGDIIHHDRVPAAAGDADYYIGQDPETKAIIWGVVER